MYITKQTSYIVAILVVLSFFVVGALFLRSPGRVRTSPPEAPSSEDSTNPVTSEESIPAPSVTEPDSSPSTNQPIDESLPLPSPMPSVSEGFALENFHRSETRNGKLLWEIVGSNARYLPDNSEVDIEKCVFIMTDKKDRRVTLRASKANIFLNGPELQTATFAGDVTLFYDDELKIMAPEATYNHSSGLVTSQSHVTVIGKWFTIEGDGLDANLENKRYQILSNVTSMLEPGRRRS